MTRRDYGCRALLDYRRDVGTGRTNLSAWESSHADGGYMGQANSKGGLLPRGTSRRGAGCEMLACALAGAFIIGTQLILYGLCGR